MCFRYIFSFQYETDRIVSILAELQKVEREIAELAGRRDNGMQWMSG